MNKVVLIGHFTKDPVEKITKSGIEQSTFSLAVNDFKSYETTYFFNCVAWGTTAKFINNNIVKGQLVGIDGRLINRSYVKQDGSTVYITEIVVDSIKTYGTIKKHNNDTPTESVQSETSSENVYDVSQILDESNELEDEFDDDLIPWGTDENEK